MTTTPTWSTLSVSWAHWPCYPATLCQPCWWTKLDVWGCWVCHAFMNVLLMLYTTFKEKVLLVRLYIWWYMNHAGFTIPQYFMISLLQRDPLSLFDLFHPLSLPPQSLFLHSGIKCHILCQLFLPVIRQYRVGNDRPFMSLWRHQHSFMECPGCVDCRTVPLG